MLETRRGVWRASVACMAVALELVDTNDYHPPMLATQTYKLALPRTEGQVSRSRQVDELAAQLRRSPVLWLLGLPGAGKTSTAAQWAARATAQGERCIWWQAIICDSC